VKIVRILPFSIERLQSANLSIEGLHHGVTSNEAAEGNEDNGLTLIDYFEPIEQESYPNNKTLDNKGIDTEEGDNKAVDSIDNMDVDQLQDFIPDVIVER